MVAEEPSNKRWALPLNLKWKVKKSSLTKTWFCPLRNSSASSIETQMEELEKRAIERHPIWCASIVENWDIMKPIALFLTRKIQEEKEIMCVTWNELDKNEKGEDFDEEERNPLWHYPTSYKVKHKIWIIFLINLICIVVMNPIALFLTRKIQ